MHNTDHVPGHENIEIIDTEKNHEHRIFLKTCHITNQTEYSKSHYVCILFLRILNFEYLWLELTRHLEVCPL